MRLAIALILLAAPLAASEVAPFVVTGDAIVAPLAGHVGDARRGEAVARNRENANCLICHSIPGTNERFMGDVGPALAGVGARLTPGQIRLRLVDPTLLQENAVMPAYHRVTGLIRVDARYAGQPVLGAQEIEDVVAYLTTLKE